jgi:hypothetical protein
MKEKGEGKERSKEILGKTGGGSCTGALGKFLITKRATGTKRTTSTRPVTMPWMTYRGQVGGSPVFLRRHPMAL